MGFLSDIFPGIGSKPLCQPWNIFIPPEPWCIPNPALVPVTPICFWDDNDEARSVQVYGLGAGILLGPLTVTMDRPWEDGKTKRARENQQDDIDDCGLLPCDSPLRFGETESRGCAVLCYNTKGCNSYTWAPKRTDPFHWDKNVCSLHSAWSPNTESKWRRKRGGLLLIKDNFQESRQVFCRMSNPNWARVPGVLSMFPRVANDVNGPDSVTPACDGEKDAHGLSYQVGQAGANVDGCGFSARGRDQCEQRYGLISTHQCAEKCSKTSGPHGNCGGYTWAGIGGDPLHPGVTVCTIYYATSPTDVTTNNQVFCRMKDPGTHGGRRLEHLESMIAPAKVQNN